MYVCCLNLANVYRSDYWRASPLSITKLSSSGSVNVFVNVLAAPRGSLYVLGNTNTHVSVSFAIPMAIGT